MEKNNSHTTRLDMILKSVGALAVVLGLITISYKYYTISLDTIMLEQSLLTTQRSLEHIQDEKTNLEAKLAEEQSKNGTYAEKLDSITSRANTLEKIVGTDKELLQKYSKVFFLNEHYKPKELTDIFPEYTLDPKKQYQVSSQVWPYLKRLLRKAERDGLDLKVTSAYRSFDMQKNLKSGYKVVYGAGTANQFSADQGYSEHQLGTTLDFTTTKIGGAFASFKSSKEYTWLLENAYRYGFVLSYPEHNKYYVFEPWHWRFVGEALAEYIHDEKINFYDMEQREIDSYLVNLFD